MSTAVQLIGANLDKMENLMVKQENGTKEAGRGACSAINTAGLDNAEYGRLEYL